MHQHPYPPQHDDNLIHYVQRALDSRIAFHIRDHPVFRAGQRVERQRIEKLVMEEWPEGYEWFASLLSRGQPVYSQEDTDRIAASVAQLARDVPICMPKEPDAGSDEGQ